MLEAVYGAERIAQVAIARGGTELGPERDIAHESISYGAQPHERK